MCLKNLNFKDEQFKKSIQIFENSKIKYDKSLLIYRI